MSVFSKLKFWKKDEDDLFKDTDFGASLGPSAPGTDSTAGLGGTEPLGAYPDTQMVKGPDFGLGQPGSSYPQYPRQVAAPQQVSQQTLMEKDLEIISSKLDAIKALVDHVNQRLENLERSSRISKGW